MTVRVTSLSSVASATGVLTVGQSVTFTAMTNRPVVVEGIPTLITSDGGIAFYVAALSTPTSMVFRYTVGLQETSSNLTVIAMTTNGGSIIGEAKLFLDGPKQYGTGDAPRDIAVADVNGDGKLDLVTANDGGNSVSVLLGTRPTGSSVTGNFGFTDATDYDAGTRPSSLAIGDFNNNGKLDIAVTNLLANTVTVLDGEGNGYFETLPSDPTGAGPVSVTAADLDGDGNLDLVITISNRKVSVLSGDGHFNFDNGVTYGVGSSPVASAAADIDGDGDTDVFVVNQNGNSVSVLLNDGLGGFGNGGTLRVGASPTDVMAVDVNDDDDIDLVITNSGDDTVSVLLGDGNGGFAPAIISNAGNNPLAVAAGDVSGDGTMDLVVVGDDGVSVLEGRGNGSFAVPATWVVGGRPTDVAVADFNKDGLADIVVTNANDDTVSVFRNTSDREESMLLPSIVLNAGTVTGFVIDGGVPSVIGRAAAAGSFGAGATLEIRIAFSESVIVSGVPQLTLNSGGTATYVGGTNTDTLVFTTTVAAGQNATNLGVTGLTLPTGARIVDVNGNNVSLAEAPGTIGGVVVDTTRPTVAVDDEATPESGRFGTGQVITITITGNEKLFVTGTPTLELNNGGTASYVSGSGTADLLFRYTIGAGQDTANLAVTGVGVAGSTIRDAAGNDAILSGASTTFTGLNIDTTAPVVVDIAVVPGFGSFDVGQVIIFTLTMSEAVSVLGNPVLQLNDGGTATYVGGDGTTTLVFSTTVAAGQNAGALAVTGVSLPDGASIRAATASAPDAYLASATEAFDAVSVNTSFPFVESLVATPRDAVFGAGAVVTLTLVMSKNVTVSGGTPYLTLDDGSVATYVSGSGTDRLVFTSVVAPGQTSPDLSVTAIYLDGAVIADAAGRPAGLTGAVGNPAGTLVIDAGAVTITAFTATASETGPLGVGDMVTFTATVDRAIVVTTTDGAPTLALSDGGTAIYDAAASTATTLVFHHTVAAGQNASNLAVEALVLNGATVAVPDTPLSISTPSTYHYGNFPNPSDSTTIADLDADGIPDIVISNYGALSILLGDGGGGFLSPITYRPDHAGGTLFIASGPAVVVDVNRDGNADVVVPSRNTGGISVALGDGDGNLGLPTHIDTRDGEYSFLANSLAVADLNRDGALDLVAGRGSFSSGTNHAIVVMSGDGNGGFSEATPFASGMSAESIQVADMNGDGHLDVVAVGAVVSGTLGRVQVLYGDGNGGLGAPTTVFTAQSEFPNELVVADLNGDGRLDVAALDFGADKLSFALADGSGGFGPVASLSTGIEPSDLAAADVNGDGKLDLVVSNTRGGDLQLFLGNGSGGFAAPVSFEAASGDIQRLGSVAAGDLNGDGRPDFVGTDWYSGNVFVLLNETLAPNVFDPDGAAGAAGSQTGLVVDTTAPHIVSHTANPGRGVYDAGQSITITLTGDEPLIVTGAPVMTLNNGATATYVGGSGTASLQFRTTVAVGKDATALAVTGVSLPAGTTIRDAAGNDADLSGAPASFPGLSIVTTPPRVVSLTASQADGTLGAGAVITLEVVLDKIVAVTRGVPTLTLSNGGLATYSSGSGTDTLVFTTTVANGQATPDLAVTAVNLNGAAVTDLRGQAANLSGAVVNPAGILAVSAPAVTVLDIEATPSVSGSLGAGSTVSFTVALTGGVTVSGTPVLTLNDGGIATYDAAASTATSLVFHHTVLAGQNTADLTVTGLTLNGAGVSVPGSLSFGAPVGAATDLGNATGSTVADVDGDGRPDAIVTMDGSYMVSVMLGTAGGFGPASAYDLGPHDGSPVIGNASGGTVVAADVNRDGRLDLIVADQGAATVSLLLGTGAGAFAPATSIRHDTSGLPPEDVAVADVNGDGNADLLVAGVTAVRLMLGDGAGGFGAPSSYEMGFGINGLATADVNGDGRLDLIASFMGDSSNGDFDTGGVSVRLGNGGSGFGPFVSYFESAFIYSAGQAPRAVVAADVNRDGRPDLVVANYLGRDVSVLLGNGFGGFGSATNYAAGLGALAVAVADLDGDGKLDLASSDAFGEIKVLRGDGAGGFGAPTTLRTTSVTGIGNLVALSAVDVNGDGRPDLVATSSGGEVVTLLNLSAAPGTFTIDGIAAAPGASTGLVVDTTPDYFTLIRGTSAGETLVGDAGKNVVFARGGNDIVRGLAGDDELNGNEGNDILYGDEGNDILYGDAGDDTLRGGAGDDTLDGSAGTGDMADYSDKTAAVSVTLNGATNAIVMVNGVAEDTIRNIERVQGGSGNDTLIGNSGQNMLSGGDGTDYLYGQAGDDMLIGGATGAAPNQLWGGEGTDTASYVGTTGTVYADIAALAGYVDGVLVDTMNSIENLTGGSGTNTLVGDGGANVLTGGSGIDYLYGQGGDDFLIGDGVPAGSTNQLWGGEGSDTASYAKTTGMVHADLGVQAGYVGGVLVDEMNSIENLTGGSNADTLVGDAGANRLTGGGGADVLWGRGGADVFVFSSYAESNLVSGYDTIGDFVSGVSKLDLRAFATDASHVVIQSDGSSTAVYVEQTPGHFNASTDTAIAFIGPHAIAIGDILFS